MANAPDDSSSILCSICMEAVSFVASGGRTVVKLRCSHLFHLDCIGSAFNASGAMQCPNCRGVENGIWRRFENDSPERSADHEDDDDDDAGDDNDDSDEEDVHSFAEMPNENRASLLTSVYCYVILRKKLERLEQKLVSIGRLPTCIALTNFTCHMPGPHLSNEIAGSLVLPHDYGRNCSCMSNSLCTRHMATGQISALDVSSLNPNVRIDPVRVPYLDSRAHQIVIEPQLVAQSSFGPPIGSGMFGFGNNGSIYDNFQRVLPPRNFPSPAVRNMSAGRIAINNLQGWSPAGNTVPYLEQTGRINHLSSSSRFFQSHPQPSNFHHNHVPGDTEPRENSRECLDLFK